MTSNRDIEDSLERLNKLTQEEARMASAEQPRVTHSVDAKVQGLRRDVQDVRGDVRDIGNRVQDVDDSVHWQGIDSNVRGVDDKFDQANRSLSL